jgi:hypothetical protein
METLEREAVCAYWKYVMPHTVLSKDLLTHCPPGQMTSCQREKSS